VPEEPLHRPDVIPVVERLRGETVPQHMGCHAFADSRLLPQPDGVCLFVGSSALNRSVPPTTPRDPEVASVERVCHPADREDRPDRRVPAQGTSCPPKPRRRRGTPSVHAHVGRTPPAHRTAAQPFHWRCVAPRRRRSAT
jgi:hypothetical protein